MATLKLPGTTPVVKEALNIVYRKEKKKDILEASAILLEYWRGQKFFVFFYLEGGNYSSVSVNVTGRR